MSIEAIKAVVVLFGILAMFIAWVATMEEFQDFMKGSLYFVGTAASGALFAIGWFIHG